MKKLYRISYTEKVISEITLRANTKEEALEKGEEEWCDNNGQWDETFREVTDVDCHLIKEDSNDSSKSISEKLIEEYNNDCDECISEFLASKEVPQGISFEEAFKTYIECMNKIESEEFFCVKEGEATRLS